MVERVISPTETGSTPVGRLAPSPTGVLHLGNARSFLLAWLSIRAAGGSLPMRIEDIDGPRVRSGAADEALSDLRWLGFDWDGEVVYQSTQLPRYSEVVDGLLATGQAYHCVCSRREVERAASAPHEIWHDAVVYPGTCRGRFASRAEAVADSGREPSIRFEVGESAVPFRDGFRGPEAGLIRGDFVIQKRDGAPAYQLAVVVDDAAMGVTEVLRGDDLLVSTPRQLLLYRALGWDPPAFVHVPLLVGEDGRRLAKRHGDTSLQRLRTDGVRAEQIIGYLACISGLRPTPDPCSAAKLVRDFDLRKVPLEPAVVREPWSGRN